MTLDHISGVRCYRFGPFVLDAHRSLLWKDRVRVVITPKAVEVLEALVADAGRLVTKDELFNRVWGTTIVEENSLARNISVLRKALEERRDQHEYIVTVPGQGYRFVASVERLERCPEPELLAPAVVSPAPSKPEEMPAFVTAEDTAVAPHHPAFSRVVPGLVAAAVVLVVVAAVFWFGTAGEPKVGSGVWQQLTYGPGIQSHPTWSPDGSRIAYASDTANDSDIWVQALDNPSPMRLTSSPSNESQPAWSPDGRWIAFRSERDGGGLYVIPASGGVERLVSRFGFRPRWSPSGSRLLFSASAMESPTPALFVVGIDGEPPRRLRPDVLSGYWEHYGAWVPHGDGSRVAIWARKWSGPAVFMLLPVDGGEPVVGAIPDGIQRHIDDGDIRLRHFVWAPSGEMYFEGMQGTSSNVWRIRVDPVTAVWSGLPERITSDTGSIADLVLSPDGDRLAFSVQRSRTRVWSLPFDQIAGALTGSGVPVTSGGAGEFDAAAPADGSRLAFRTTRGGRQEVWSRLVDDGSERLLVSSRDATRTSPRWSKDGRMLAYLRRPVGNDSVMRTAMIGILTQDSGEERLLEMPTDTWAVPDDWSADGTTLLAACRPPGGGFAICVLPVSSKGAAPIHVLARDSDRSLISPRFSPDQRWISFMALDREHKGGAQLYVMPAVGGPWTPITDGRSYDDKPRWSADGRTIYYLSDRGGFANIWGQRIEPTSGRPTGEPFQLTAFDSASRQLDPYFGRVEIAVARDRIFVPLTETEAELWTLNGLTR